MQIRIGKLIIDSMECIDKLNYGVVKSHIVIKVL